MACSLFPSYPFIILRKTTEGSYFFKIDIEKSINNCFCFVLCNFINLSVLLTVFRIFKDLKNSVIKFLYQLRKVNTFSHNYHEIGIVADLNYEAVSFVLY